VGERETRTGAPAALDSSTASTTGSVSPCLDPNAPPTWSATTRTLAGSSPYLRANLAAVAVTDWLER
jgi:hypothetical protein